MRHCSRTTWTIINKAIGIPCRSITNYSSAHDTDGSITIDRVFNIEGVKESNDSTWNFHVWNEVWMRRPDIPKGKYDGWQAIDCTPQERSSGLFQCGPMPVAAMKEGDLSYNYDGAFIFAEVNADIVTWVNGRDGQPYLSDIERQRVGRDISTRKPGDSKVNVREDITDAYKYKEGTAEEKESVLTALKVASTHSEENYKAYKGYINNKEKNVEAKLDIQSQTKYGDDFVVCLTAINKSEKEQSVYGTVSCKPENYAAEGLDRIKFSDIDGAIPPKGEDGKISLEVTVTTNDYMGKLHDGCYISVVGVLFNYTTQQASLIEKSFRLKKPELIVETTEKDLKLNQPFYVKMSFTNPLNQTLKKCEIDIEGVGIIGPAEGSLPQGDVDPGKEFTTQIQVTATRPGFSRIGAVFTCADLYDVAGNCWVLAL